jgi:hypothetical protein
MSGLVHTGGVTGGLGSARGVKLVLLGGALWAIGMGGVHLAAVWGVFMPAWSALLLAMTLPMAWATLRLIRRVSGADASGMVEVTALVSAPALLLDGVALTWAPSLYDATEAGQRAAGAWLLWFVGVSLVMAFAGARQAQR